MTQTNEKYNILTGTKSPLDFSLVIASSGAGSYLPLAGGEMVSGSKITWEDGNDPATSGLVWFEPDGISKRGELSASYLRLGGPVLNASAPMSELTPYSLSICTGITGGVGDISFATTTDGNGITTLNQSGNAFTIDSYGVVKAKSGSGVYYTISQDGLFQSASSGQATAKINPLGLTFRTYESGKWYQGFINSRHVEIGTAFSVTSNETALGSSTKFNSTVNFNSGILISNVDNVLTTLTSSILGTDDTGKIINVISNIYNQYIENSEKTKSDRMYLTYDKDVQVFTNAYGSFENNNSPYEAKFRNYNTIVRDWALDGLWGSTLYSDIAVIAPNGLGVGGIINIHGSQPGISTTGTMYGNTSNKSIAPSRYMPKICMFDKSIIWTGILDSTSCANSGSGNFGFFFGSLYGESYNSVNLVSNKQLIISTNHTYTPYEESPSVFISSSSNIFIDNAYRLLVTNTVPDVSIHPSLINGTSLNVHSYDVNFTNNHFGITAPFIDIGYPTTSLATNIYALSTITYRKTIHNTSPGGTTTLDSATAHIFTVAQSSTTVKLADGGIDGQAMIIKNAQTSADIVISGTNVMGGSSVISPRITAILFWDTSTSKWY